MKLKGLLNNVKFKVKKHSPEILVVSGVVGFVGAAVLACRATPKVLSLVQEAKSLKENAENLALDEDNEAYTADDLKRDKKIITVQTAAKVGLAYAPALLTAAASAAMIFAAHGIMKKRGAALTAALAATEESLRKYKERVKDTLGADADEELTYGIKTEEIEETDEKGKVKKTKVKLTDDPLGASPYAFVYDKSTSEAYEDNNDYNLMFLRAKQEYFTNYLRFNRYLFLDKIMDELGMTGALTPEQIKCCQIVGWVYNENDPDSDNFVDFGAKEILVKNKDGAPEKKILLDFNVQGNILDRI